MRRLLAPVLVLGLLAGCGGGDGPPVDPPTPTAPLQAPSGPGGAAYAYGAVRETGYGSGNGEYWILEPDPVPLETLPVVVFHHGFGVMSTAPYLEWLEHLVRRGAIVIYPRYHASLLTPPATFTANALGAIQAALAELQNPGHATPDLTRFAMTGHSYGAAISANIAALAATSGLPTIDALMIMQAGTGGNDTYEDYGNIPAGTLLLCVVGEDDTRAFDTVSLRIYREATAIPVSDKDFILVRTDTHGEPDLIADHQSPATGLFLPANALDWYGTWKWFDALMDAAFFGTNRDAALGNTPAQRHMGTWSDGVAVREAVVTDPP